MAKRKNLPHVSVPLPPHIQKMADERQAEDEAARKRADTDFAVPLGLACKLASAIVHADELLSPFGHKFDKVAFEQALNDPAVREWLAKMTKAGFAPLKRSA